ncbi:MAG TPA: hypothetical protein VGP73_09940 [Thermoanaerobaculia bacterium]
MIEEMSGMEGFHMTEVDGGSVTTDLGYSIKVNGKSTLRRKWLVINDSSCPMQLCEAGVNISFGNQQYYFVQVGGLSSSEAISAFEIRYALYDVFGRHLKTLSTLSVVDMPAGHTGGLSESRWRAWENEVSALHTVIAFVAHVRGQSGRLWRFREKQISDQLTRIDLLVSSGALDPTKDK